MTKSTLTQCSFNHSRYFYSASSSPLLLRGAPNTARILCWSFTPKCHRQLRVKDLSKVSTWHPERDSNPRPFRQKVNESTNEPPCPMCCQFMHVYVNTVSFLNLSEH